MPLFTFPRTPALKTAFPHQLVMGREYIPAIQKLRNIKATGAIDREFLYKSADLS